MLCLPCCFRRLAFCRSGPAGRRHLPCRGNAGASPATHRALCGDWAIVVGCGGGPHGGDRGSAGQGRPGVEAHYRKAWHTPEGCRPQAAGSPVFIRTRWHLSVASLVSLSLLPRPGCVSLLASRHLTQREGNKISPFALPIAKRKATPLSNTSPSMPMPWLPSLSVAAYLPIPPPLRHAISGMLAPPFPAPSEKETCAGKWCLAVVGPSALAGVPRLCRLCHRRPRSAQRPAGRPAGLKFLCRGKISRRGKEFCGLHPCTGEGGRS